MLKETRKQRIATQKIILNRQKKELRNKKVRHMTTFAGASFLMGSAVAPSLTSGKVKAAVETVSANETNLNTATSSTSSVANSTTSTSSTDQATSSSQSQSSQTTSSSQSQSQPVVKPQVTENDANKAATAQPKPTQAQPVVGTQNTGANIATAQAIMAYSSTSASTFINSIASSARQLASENDLYASVMIAQASLESGFGNSALGKAPNYNLFGVKGSYNGSSVYMLTNEDDGHGNLYQINAAFRKYPSYYQSLQDYVHVLKNTSFGSTPYYQGAFKSHTTSYQNATQYLQGRYATATNYAASLNRLIQQYNLTQYDTPATSGNNGGTGTTPTNPTTPTTPTKPTNGEKYTVKAGDSVYGIAKRYGISMSTLISWNNIKNNMIHPGDVLIVSANKPTTPTNPTKPANGEKYTVKAGDSVYGIAKRYGISMNTLISWNNIKNNMIHPGDVLIVSAKQTTNPTTPTNPTKPTNPTNPTTPANNQTYTVKSGDSVWAISNRYGVSMANLVKWNNIRNNFIYPGQKLIVGQKSTGQTTPPTNNNNNSSSNNNNGSTTTTAKTYKVKAGDSVWRISQQSGISMAELVRLNNIKNNFIYPGQVLKVSAGKTTTNNNNQTTPNKTKSYTVKSGDSLWSIAQKNGTTISQLKTANNLRSDLILVGQVLKLK